MEKIYFDKQIFSHLFKQTDPIYQNLYDELYSSKDKFIFYYSHAHLLDLKNDKTDIKYDELKFIESLVEDNYLSYHGLTKKTSSYLARPLEAFKDIEEDNDKFKFSDYFETIDLSNATEEEKKAFDIAIDILKSNNLKFGIPQLSELPPEISELMLKLLPFSTEGISLMDWAQNYFEVLRNLEEDKTVYKGLRNVVDNQLNKGKFKIDYDTIDFNNEMKNSELKKSFTEFVSSSINPNGNKVVSDYDFYTNAYFSLDLLGISKEPSKSVKFRNMVNDGFHSYYGAFCDYIVSDDIGFLKKTKALYKLLNIQTKVFHIDDFIPYFKVILNSIEQSELAFINLLLLELQNGLVISQNQTLTINRNTTVIKPSSLFLGYFNTINIVLEDNIEFVFLSREIDNYSKSTYISEIKGVVNRAVKLFGIDVNYRGKFDDNIDTIQLNENKWEGRLWELNGISMLLVINTSADKFCLQINSL